jgi:hypothetical protein
MALAVAPQSESAAISSCVVSSLGVSVSTTVSIFAKYVWVDHFPMSAYLNIGATFVLSLFQIGLAATDLAFINKSEGDQNMLYALWIISYWGVFMSGSILMQFYKIYWSSGRFTMKSKVVFSIKTLLLKIVVGTAIMGVCGIIMIKFYGENFTESIQGTVLILQNVYGMAVLVLLLAHGLIKLPIYLWKKNDNTYNLINALSRAERVRRDYRTALIEYHEQISICKSLENQHANGYNRHFFDILLSEIPENDLEGQKIRILKSIGDC